MVAYEENSDGFFFFGKKTLYNELVEENKNRMSFVFKTYKIDLP